MIAHLTGLCDGCSSRLIAGDTISLWSCDMCRGMACEEMRAMRCQGTRTMTTPSLLFNICADCGKPFLGDDDDEICPDCRRRREEWR